MPDEKIEIALLKQELKEFKEICRDRWDREDDYLLEFKKNLHDVSESLRTVIDTQNKQISYVAGITTTVFTGILAAWAVFSWFFSK